MSSQATALPFERLLAFCESICEISEPTLDWRAHMCVLINSPVPPATCILSALASPGTQGLRPHFAGFWHNWGSCEAGFRCECHRFLTALSVRPGSNLEISSHLFPQLPCVQLEQ